MNKNSKSRKTSISTIIGVIVNMCFVLLLILSYLAQYVSPTKVWELSFIGFLYPVLLIINLFFILFWLVFLKKYFIISLLAILLGFNNLKAFIRFGEQDLPDKKALHFRIMSYNVRLFDLYNWKNSHSRTTQEKIFSLIKRKNPDILCLQEYYSGAGKNADFADTISHYNHFTQRYISLIDKQKNKLPYGLAIFSKFPIVGTQVLEFKNSAVNYCQVVDLLIGSDTIRVFNLHLESVKFGREDYNFVSEISNSITENNKISRGSKAIFAKMRSAYLRRASQIETIVAAIKNSPHPVLLAGDFNDTSVSYCYKQVSNELSDSFVSAGKGLGATYAEFLPFLRIDYIFHSKGLIVNDFGTVREAYSDHYPILASFSVSQNE